MSESDIERARLRTLRAKARLTAALSALKQRLLPSTIARNLFESGKAKAADAAEASVDAVRARPGIAVGVAALAALLLARKPIARAISPERSATTSRPARSRRKPVRKAKP